MKTTSRIADHVVAAALTVLMLLWLWQATRLPYTVEGRPGAGFFPVWLSAIGAALGIAVLAAGIRSARAGSEPESQDADPDQLDDSESRWAGTLRLVGALLGAIAFLALMPVLGFVLALALYLTFLCLAVVRMHMAKALALSVGTAVTIYLIFDELLGVPFPSGLMGI